MPSLSSLRLRHLALIFVVLPALFYISHLSLSLNRAYGASQAGDLMRLSGQEIQSLLPGLSVKERDKEEGWQQSFFANGNFELRSELGEKKAGQWQVSDNELCHQFFDGRGWRCFEVWAAPFSLTEGELALDSKLDLLSHNRNLWQGIVAETQLR